jgi:arylsulfatase A-like enzyme
MNILYMHAHDIGRFASIYGAEVETPNLEQFAAAGATVFTNAFNTAPTCSPSRAGLLTGEYPHQAGMLGLAHLGHSLTRPERHLAHWLRNNGYTTVLSGVQHVFDFNHPELLPYDEVMELDWSGGTAGRDVSTAKGAVQWLEKHDGAKPFFLSVGFFWPHVPLPEVSEGAPENRIKPWPDVEAGRLDTAALRQAMTHTDACIGQVLDALAASRFADDTLVLITTDHGIPFPLNKATLLDRGTGVLFMLRVPGIHGPARSDALVSQLDFFPTICELTGLEPPEWLQGESLLPVLKGVDTQREAVYLQTNHHVDYEPMRAVRTRTHKLIRHCADALRCRANVDATHLKDYVSAQGFFDENVPEWELYDLENDPDEQNNLAGHAEVRTLQDELQEMLTDWMRATNDPLAEPAA